MLAVLIFWCTLYMWFETRGVNKKVNGLVEVYKCLHVVNTIDLGILIFMFNAQFIW